MLAKNVIFVEVNTLNIMHILIVEDEAGIRNFLKEGLQEEGYTVAIAGDGHAGLKSYEQNKPDLVLLDWMMPGMSGIDVCKSIREKDSNTPILFLTAKDTVNETIEGLRSGANDYIKKPFSFEELLERIKIHFRGKSKIEILTLGSISINKSTYQVFNGTDEVALTQREFELLEFLIKSKGTVCTRDEIIDNVWGINFEYDTGVIDVFMNAIRKKFHMNKETGNIKTIREIGFIAND